MKNFLLLVLVFSLFLPAIAKKRSKENLEVDYLTLNSETILILKPTTEYNVKFINLPTEITSAKLRKDFKRNFVDISSSRIKVKSASTTHRVRTFKVYNDLLPVKLGLYKKIKSNKKNDKDGEDNILVSTVTFNVKVPPLTP